MPKKDNFQLPTVPLLHWRECRNRFKRAESESSWGHSIKQLYPGALYDEDSAFFYVSHLRSWGLSPPFGLSYGSNVFPRWEPETDDATGQGVTLGIGQLIPRQIDPNHPVIIPYLQFSKNTDREELWCDYHLYEKTFDMYTIRDKGEVGPLLLDIKRVSEKCKLLLANAGRGQKIARKHARDVMIFNSSSTVIAGRLFILITVVRPLFS